MSGRAKGWTSGIGDGFKAANRSCDKVTSYATPRRLAVLIRGLDVQAPDSEIVAWGPPVNVAFDDVGQPTLAA